MKLKNSSEVSKYMGPWAQTYTGERFDYTNIESNIIDIRDISHALSMQTRWNGHCNRFYSIAEHSCHVSRVVSPEYALWGLLHDAAEAYIGDLSSPLKLMLPLVKEIEGRIEACVANTFGLQLPKPPEVKDADLAMLFAEKYQVFDHVLDWQWHVDPAEIKLSFWSPTMAKIVFMNRFRELTDGRF